MTGSIVPGLGTGLANTRYDWNYTSIPQLGLDNRSLSIQRGYILGGTSSVSEYLLCTVSNPDLHIPRQTVWCIHEVLPRTTIGLQNTVEILDGVGIIYNNTFERLV